MNLKKIVGIAIPALVVLSMVVWFFGSSNPETPAGYVGYLTQGSVFGKTKFYGLQTGPTSPGKTWLLSVTNISVTPYTYSEDFSDKEQVLAKDNLSISFRVHLVFKIKPDRVKEFFEKYSYIGSGDGDKKDTPDKLVEVAYGNLVKEPLRTYARDEVQKHKGLEVKENITSIGEAVQTRIKLLTDNTPFDVSNVVVGNIQYPPQVTNAVSLKMATTQLLEQKNTEIQIEAKEKEKRITQAEGIAKAMEIIRTQLTNQYLQHEGIEAQKAMVGSPNHTTIYIPVGNNGVPLVGTFDAAGRQETTNTK